MNPKLDESKLLLHIIIYTHYHQYIWRRSNERYNSECLQPSGKHGGGSFMTQGWISASGDLFKTDGILKQKSTSLINNVIPENSLMDNDFMTMIFHTLLVQ